MAWPQIDPPILANMFGIIHPDDRDARILYRRVQARADLNFMNF
jgi:hypothetical protein